jgi:hypothetical protein
MSTDQKPARIRALSSSAGALPAHNDAETGTATPEAQHTEAQAASGSSLLSILLFLIGCGAGGAAVAALPHFIAGH